jgi:membrane fusion protein, multidrug efflux system
VQEVTQPLSIPKHRNGVRYAAAALGLLLVIGSLVGVKFTQISGLMKAGKEMQKAGPPPEAVSVTVSREENWEGTLSAVGTIAANKGVSVSNDAPGVVSKISFESGAVVKDGQVLVELDSSVERAQLASAIVRRDLANLTVNRSRALVNQKAIAQAQADADESQLRAAATDIGALQAQIERKVVKAPFAGRLGIRAVNLGQYLSPGTTITVLEATDSVFVDFTLPQQRLGDLKTGMPVRVTTDAKGANPASPVRADGVLAAVDPSVDSTSRTVKLRATVPNKDEKLRPGMFAQVTVVLPDHKAQVIIPATSIVHAPYGDSVFLLEDKKDDGGKIVNGPDGKPLKVARQQFVKVGEARGDFVAILDGVPAGREVVSAGAFKLRNGSGVVITQDTKPAPQLSPRPENR